MGFGSDFTDNPASPGSGGESIATFFLGIPDGGEITSLHNVDYHRQIYAVYALDDWKGAVIFYNIVGALLAANIYLLASASGVVACGIRIITAYVPGLQHIERGSLVWFFACTCGAGFALASAHSWRIKTKWFQRASH